MKKLFVYIEFGFFWIVSKVKRIYLPKDKILIPVILDLPDYEIQFIKDEAKRRKISSSQLVNEMLKEFLKTQ